jgi:hypothetical protein
MSPGETTPETTTDLLVPFEEKDEAKGLGARWDQARKLWYVPAGLAVAPFEKWLPPKLKTNGQYDDRPTVRGDGFIIVENFDHRICWKCKEVTSVFAFLLPTGHEVLNTDGGERDGQWERVGYAQFLSGVTYINENAMRAIRGVAGEDYKLDFHHGFFWLNHCEECGALLADWFDHDEPNGAFTDAYGNENGISIYKFDEAFEAGANTRPA